MLRFQSTFPRGERRFLRGGSRLVSYFNPRSLVGNDAIDIKFYVPKIDFNPRSLVGNDGLHFHRDWRRFISIHVPSWGTTAVKKNTSQDETDFNPRSLVGNDECDGTYKALNADFNPRSLVGNDGKFSQIFFVFLCNKYNFSTFYYPFSLFFSVIHVTFLIFVVRILPAFYVYF